MTVDTFISVSAPLILVCCRNVIT